MPHAGALTAPSPGASRAAATDAAGFLATLRADARPAFLSLRALALSLGPEVGERVTPGEVTYLRRDRPFVRVRTSKSHVTLVFPEGLHLDDPHGRLLRRGDERYVALDSPDSLDGHVQEFVRKAYAALR